MQKNMARGRKWYTAVVLFLVSALLFAACDASSPEASSVAAPAQKGPPPAISAVGDIVEFGGNRWIVLELHEDKALLISERTTSIPITWYTGVSEVASTMCYDRGGGRPITWEECTLRNDLNTSYIEWFAPEEQMRILKTTVKNDDNPEYGTEGGNDTEDWFFLLSIEEVQRYFPDDASRVAINDYDEPMRWWLRSPGRPTYYENFETHIAIGVEGRESEEVTLNGYVNDTAAVVEDTGEILVHGAQASELGNYRDGVPTPDGKNVSGGIRPVFWLDLTS